MNPKPFWELNHFTVPTVMTIPFGCEHRDAAPRTDAAITFRFLEGVRQDERLAPLEARIFRPKFENPIWGGRQAFSMAVPAKIAEPAQKGAPYCTKVHVRPKGASPIKGRSLRGAARRKGAPLTGVKGSENKARHEVDGSACGRDKGGGDGNVRMFGDRVRCHWNFEFVNYVRVTVFSYSLIIRFCFAVLSPILSGCWSIIECAPSMRSTPRESPYSLSS